MGVDPLRQLGTHKVVVRLSADIHPEVTVIIESEEGEEPVAETPVTPADLADEEEEFDEFDEYEEFEEAV